MLSVRCSIERRRGRHDPCRPILARDIARLVYRGFVSASFRFLRLLGLPAITSGPRHSRLEPPGKHRGILCDHNHGRHGLYCTYIRFQYLNSYSSTLLYQYSSTARAALISSTSNIEDQWMSSSTQSSHTVGYTIYFWLYWWTRWCKLIHEMKRFFFVCDRML